MENYEDDSGLILPYFEDSDDKIMDEDGAGYRNSNNSEGALAACATSQRVGGLNNPTLLNEYG